MAHLGNSEGSQIVGEVAPSYFLTVRPYVRSLSSHFTNADCRSMEVDFLKKKKQSGLGGV